MKCVDCGKEGASPSKEYRCDSCFEMYKSFSPKKRNR